MKIEPGYGYITAVEGVPGPSSGIAYTCTYVLPDGVHEGVEGQLPIMDRWPDPVVVQPHSPGVAFPAFRVDDYLQMFMYCEQPQTAPCPGGSLWPRGGSLLVEIAAMSPDQRAHLRRLIMEDA